jgi:hypothetical protein
MAAATVEVEKTASGSLGRVESKLGIAFATLGLAGCQSQRQGNGDDSRFH